MRKDDFGLEDMARAMPGQTAHRAYVGQPQRFDVMGASQFALLFLLGLREHHRLLDFGCGSLRLGRLAIPYLGTGRYFGVEPLRELIEAGFTHELGEDIRALKQPRFSHNDDYRIEFDEEFDFIIAQSVFSHTGRTATRKGLAALGGALAPGGLILMNMLLGQPSPGDDEVAWAYPACVPYAPSQVQEIAAEAGLVVAACPWPHPGLWWFVLARSVEHLPSAARLASLRMPPPVWD